MSVEGPAAWLATRAAEALPVFLAAAAGADPGHPEQQVKGNIQPVRRALGSSPEGSKVGYPILVLDNDLTIDQWRSLPRGCTCRSQSRPLRVKARN
jgi:hypothetical protein